MNDNAIVAQYSTGLSRRNIEHALASAGKDLDHLQPADLGMIEDFHTMGRLATAQLADLAKITSEDMVLDAGGGIGGTARFLADQRGCHVTSVDLTEEYCDTARWLNHCVGLGSTISVHHGDVTRLPFADAAFQVVVTQHVQMNVADKPSLYREARRVLVTGGRLALWDITAGTPGQLDYPLPWADRPERSHLVTTDELYDLIESSGFVVDQWNDLTEQAVTVMQAIRAMPPNPLGLHAFVERFSEKVDNLVRGLADGRLRATQAVAQAI
jgi:sarcosine/dimethylglycine N-methyltransferase